MAGSRQLDGSGSPSRSITGHVDEWEELAIDFLDGKLDAATKAAVDKHLEACAACAARLGVQQAVCNALRQVALEEAPSGLEDEIVGEILFPAAPRRSVVPAAQPSRRSMWRRRFRPWIPASVAVVAFFAIVVSFGVLRSGGAFESTDVTTTAAAAQSTTMPKGGEGILAAAPTTAAPGTTVAAADAEMTTMNDGSSTDTAGTGAPSPTTTAGAATTYAPAAQDKQMMVAELQAASAPLYFVYLPADPDAGATSDETGAALAEQMAMLTGLQPAEGDLALDGATFAAFVPKKDATAFVELLQSIGASLQLTLNLVSEPIALPASNRTAEYGAALRERKAELPELFASRTPQPAITKYSFTTSTVVADSGQVPPGWTAPDDAGTHVLVVIYLGE